MTAPPALWGPRAGAWVQPLQGTRAGPPAASWPQAPPLPVHTLLCFDLEPLHPPPSGLGWRDWGQRRDVLCGMQAGGVGSGVSSSWFGALLASPEGTEPLVLPLVLLFFPGPGGQPSRLPHSLSCTRDRGISGSAAHPARCLALERRDPGCSFMSRIAI